MQSGELGQCENYPLEADEVAELGQRIGDDFIVLKD